MQLGPRDDPESEAHPLVTGRRNIIREKCLGHTDFRLLMDTAEVCVLKENRTA